MKKLITLLSAATVAIGLYAYTDTGTSFEGLTAGEIDITTTTDDLPVGAGGSGFWATNGSDKVTLTVKEQQRIRSVNVINSTVPQFLDQEPDIEQLNYLSVQTTFGNAVTRKVKSAGGYQDIGDQFYFDSLVKFTAFDEDPMTTAVAGDFDGAKIAVWAQEVEYNGTPQTNVFVRAGYIGGEVRNYNCGQLGGAFGNPDDWYRLTIKAIKDVYQDGSDVTCFVVFINGQSIADDNLNKKGLTSVLEGGKYAGFYTKGAIFPSMIQDAVGSTGLASVSFDGQGDIDDVVFTETPPFEAAEDGDNAVATFNGQAFADVASLMAAVDEASAEVLAATTVKFFADTTDSAEFATTYPFTVDLNGRTIGGLVATDAVVTLIDSSDPQVGKINGWVSLAEGSVLNAGKFLKEDDEGNPFYENGAADFAGYVLPEGLSIIDGEGDDAGYFVLGESTVIYVAEHPWFENPRTVVLAENLPGQTGNIVSAFHGQGAGSYLGLTYSTNPLQFDLFGVDGTNALTTIHSVAAGDVTDPGFRGVAISETLGVAMTLAYAKTTTMYTFPLTPMVGGNGQKAVTKSSDYGFDAAAFSPDGNYLFSNVVAGPTGEDNTYFVKWAVSADENTGALALTKVGSITAGGRGRSLAYARINGRDLVFGLVDTGKVVVIDMTGDTGWEAADMITDLPAHSYGTLCVSGVNCVDAEGNPATPHLTVATSINNNAAKADVLNVYALTVPDTGAVTATLTKSFDEDALTALGFGDISDANRYGNTVYVTDDEATIYFARPDNKLYAAQYEPPVDISVIWLAGASGTYQVGDNYPLLVTEGTTEFTIEGVRQGTVITFAVVNADGATKTATVTAAPDVAFDASGYTFGWADYLGDAVSGAYTIDDAADLEMLRRGVASGLETAGETFKQTANIDMTDAGAFAGVGTYAADPTSGVSFKGTYDGQNFKISNVTMTTRNYAGIFNQINGGTVQNLTVENISAPADASGEFGFAIVGNAGNGATLKNLVAAGSFGSAEKPGTHNMAGIAIRLSAGGDGTLVQDCTNNAAIYGTYTKLAGICALTQVKVAGGAVTFNGCVNNGTLTMPSGDTAGRDGLAGIVGYVSDNTVLVDCSNTGAITSTLATAKIGELVGYSYSSYPLTDQGGNSGDATKKLVNTRSGAISGFLYATVDNGVATTVTTLAKDTTYLLEGDVAASETPVFTLAAAGDTIAFDTALGYTFAGTVASSGIVSSETAGTVTTYSASAAYAEIGTVKYGSFAAALAAAVDGDTITLLDDVTEPKFTIAQGKFGTQGLTIDLGGYTYTFEMTTASADSIYLLVSNKVTIANGTIAAEPNSTYRDVIRNYDSDLTLNNVTFDGANFPPADGAKLACLLCVEGGDVDIIGSTSFINVKPEAYAIKIGNHAQAWYEMGTTTVNTTGNIAGNILIAGGVYNEVAVGAGSTISYFYGKNVHSSWEDGVSSANFEARTGVLPDGAGSQDNVSGQLFKSLRDAVAAADTDGTVTVLKDCAIAGTPVSFAKNITVHCDYTIGANVDYALCLGATVTFEGMGMIQRGSGISGSAFCVGANEKTRGAITAGTSGTLIFDGLTVCGGSGGNLIKLENGTVEMNGGVLKDGLRGIKADADAGSYTSAIVINGGTITNCSAYAVFASAESATGKATITINGGEIAGVVGKAGKGDETITIPGTSTAKFDRDQTDFCETGYETKLQDGWYVVTKISGGGLDPSHGSTETTVAADSAEAAIAAVEITVPEGSGADATAYKALFNITATPSAEAGKYDVVIEGIKDEKIADVKADAVATLLDSTDSTIAVPAGLYYRITPSSGLPISGTAVDGLSTGSVNVTKPAGTTQGFFKLQISATPIVLE